MLYATLARIRRPATGRLNSGVRPFSRMILVLSIVSADSYFRIEFFCRNDGSYGYTDLKNSGTHENPIWVEYANSSSRFDSIETARAEASGRVAWLKKEAEWLARENEPIPTKPYREGWIRCPFCGIRFSMLDKDRWGGGRHLTCGQRISIHPLEV